MRLINIDDISKVLVKKGYDLFEDDSKPFNLNLVGIRSDDMTPNVFNDLFTMFWKDDGQWSIVKIKCTTDPGTYWLKNPSVKLGTAILKPGQYRGMWQLGKHQGKYDALVQRGECTVIRDANGDNVLNVDSGVEETGYFGINSHHASYTGESVQVDKWSAGCQVISNIHEDNLKMYIVKSALEYWGNSFTYTLLTEADF